MLFTDFTMKFDSLWNLQACLKCLIALSVFFCVPLFNCLLDMRWIIAVAVIV